MVDFEKAPLLVIWETTRSCALACRHCRADAILGRDPFELSTAEGKELLTQVADMGTPIVVLSGGDPLNRPDLEELVRHAKGLGLRVGTIPAATPALTRERLEALKEAGLDQVAFSLDGPTAAVHDALRGVDGAYERTLQGARWAHEVGLPLQINTCLSSANYAYVDEMIGRVKSLGVVFWEVFFLIGMGRGRSMRGLEPAEFDAVFEKLHAVSREGEFVVKLTEGQHFRRFAWQKGQAAPAVTAAAPRAAIHGGLTATAQAVNAGKGFLFVDHLGNICPSGFLPITAGNVTQNCLSEVYRRAPLFRRLRDQKLLKGKCGRCRFSSVCGGSRARAWALTGDYLAEDPACGYRDERMEVLR